MTTDTNNIATPTFPLIKAEMLDRLGEQAERLGATQPAQNKNLFHRLLRGVA